MTLAVGLNHGQANVLPRVAERPLNHPYRFNRRWRDGIDPYHDHASRGFKSTTKVKSRYAAGTCHRHLTQKFG